MKDKGKNNRDNIDNRKLSEAEQVRKADYEALKERLESQGYREHKLTMTSGYANTMAIVVALPIIIPLIIVYVLRNEGLDYVASGEGSLLWAMCLLVLIVAHEGIHGITWGIFAENHFKSISFGFILKYLTPYCTCKDVLKKYQIIVGAVMPTIILGILPSIVGIFLGSGFWFWIGIIMIIGGGGDFLCVWNVLSYRSDAKEKLYMDHPYEIGTVVFER